MTAGSCFVTLAVTFIFNWITNRPKAKKQEREQEREERKQEQAEFREELLQDVKAVRDEANKQNEDCQRDHKCLAKIVGEIQKTNLAQNVGLQSVLKDLLKIRYLEWIHNGYAPMDARDDLESMYQAYHGLNGNGVVTELRNKFLELPVDPPKDK